MNKHRTILDIMHHYINNGIDKMLECSSFSIDRFLDTGAVMHLHCTNGDLLSTYIIRPNVPNVDNTIDIIFRDSITLWMYNNNSTEIDILNCGEFVAKVDVSTEESLFQYSTVLSERNVQLLKIAHDIIGYNSVVVTLRENYKDVYTSQRSIEEYNKISPVPYKV